jgi:AcrR family transcriptional regulator
MSQASHSATRISAVRADAARNLEAVLTTGARMLAADPGASIASIATQAGVDRRTVYRRFASREDLLAAIYEARLTAIEHAIQDARLREAPVTVALHRYVENIITVNRTWPVDLTRMPTDEAIRRRRDTCIAGADAFLRRAAEEGPLRRDQPRQWAGPLLPDLVHLAAHQLAHPSPGQAAGGGRGGRHVCSRDRWHSRRPSGRPCPASGGRREAGGGRRECVTPGSKGLLPPAGGRLRSTEPLPRDSLRRESRVSHAAKREDAQRA